jgi:hypothetical protein
VPVVVVPEVVVPEVVVPEVEVPEVVPVVVDENEMLTRASKPSRLPPERVAIILPERTPVKLGFI